MLSLIQYSGVTNIHTFIWLSSGKGHLEVQNFDTLFHNIVHTYTYVLTVYTYIHSMHASIESLTYIQ